MPIPKLIYYLLMVAAFLAVTMRHNKLPPRFRWIILIIGVGLLTQWIDEFWRVDGKHQFFMFKLMHLVEYIGFTGYFYSALKGKVLRKAVLISLPAFALFYLVFFLAYPQLWNVDGYTEFTLQAVLVSLFSLFLLFDIYRDDSLLRPWKLPDFWVVVAHIIYFPGSALIIGSKDYFMQNAPELGSVLNEVHHYLNYALYIAYSIGFLMKWDRDISSSSS